MWRITYSAEFALCPSLQLSTACVKTTWSFGVYREQGCICQISLAAGGVRNFRGGSTPRQIQAWSWIRTRPTRKFYSCFPTRTMHFSPRHKHETCPQQSGGTHSIQSNPMWINGRRYSSLPVSFTTSHSHSLASYAAEHKIPNHRFPHSRQLNTSPNQKRVFLGDLQHCPRQIEFPYIQTTQEQRHEFTRIWRPAAKISILALH